LNQQKNDRAIGGCQGRPEQVFGVGNRTRDAFCVNSPVIVFFCGLGLSYLIYQKVPKGFVPVEDQGYFITVIQAPEGASLEYTSDVSKQVEAVLQKIPEVDGVFGVTGFSFTGTAPNRGLVFATLKTLSDRKGDIHSAESIVNRARPSGRAWPRRRCRSPSWRGAS